MNKKHKNLPVYLMLITGAVTGIITYLLQYEGKTALLILLGVLLFFYIAGSLFAGLINRFEKEQDEKERKRLEEEGKVLEKERAAKEAADEKDNKDDKEESPDEEDSVKDAGEQ